jgi:hypothetical protein
MIGRRILDSMRLVASLVLFVMLMAGYSIAGSNAPVTSYKTIASDTYVYGYPLVLAYQFLYNYSINPNSGQYMAPLNKIHVIPHIPTPKDGVYVTNFDTPYCWLWMDLRAEPMVLSVPAVAPPRYYAVQLSDPNNFNFGYIGSRSTGTEAGDYLVVGPDWKGGTYRGIKKIYRSGSNFTLAVYRTQLLNNADLPNVVAIQRQYKVTPLSTYLGTPPPAPVPLPNFPVFKGKLGDRKLDHFFEYLEFVLGYCPAGPEEADIRRKLGKLGVGEYKTFNYRDLPAAQKAEVEDGLKDGIKRVDRYAMVDGAKVINGWQIQDVYGDRAHFNGDWLKRSAGAKGGGFGNSSQEGAYLTALNLYDKAGKLIEPLNGSKRKYTLTFQKGSLPPVDAFWSVTMYDQAHIAPIPNTDRHFINTLMLPQLKRNADGSLTIYIQKDSPGAALESNWLPAPDGRMFITLRMYAPTQAPPSILPPGQGTWNPPPIVVAE